MFIENKKKKTLTLFLTYGSSLKQWKISGILERELLLYYKLEKKFNIIIISYGTENENIYLRRSSNIKIIYNKHNHHPIFYSLLLPFKYKKIIKNSDFYKTNQLWGSHVAIWTKFFFNKPLILRQGYDFLKHRILERHSKIKINLYKIYEKISFLFCDQSVVTTQNIKFDIKKRYRLHNKKITVIPNYIVSNSSNFKIKSSNKKKNFIFVGRLEEQKNLFNIIKVFKKLTQHNLTIIGNGSLEKELKKFSKNYKNIQFENRQEQKMVFKKIRKNNFFILPSLYEGHPKILLETMSLGIPVLSTNYKGIKNIIRHGENGFLTNFDSKSLSESVINLVNYDKKKIQIVANNAMKFVKLNFDISRIVDMEEKLYENIK